MPVVPVLPIHAGQRLTLLLVMLTTLAWGITEKATAAEPQDADDRVVRAEDMPRIPHTELNRAISTFKLAAGFQAELVAGEPLVADPIDACFDEFGRMYVAEMHGYPFSQESTRLNPEGGGLKDGGIIRLLEDTDGDGQMDRSVVYASGLRWPTSVACYDGGLFVLAPSRLYYLKDTDGDDKADLREVVLDGFGRGNVQALANGLKWGLDNRITFAAGRNTNQLKWRDKKAIAVGRNDLSFDPKTESFELATGGQQYGHSFDAWGVRFVCSNSNHMQQVILPLKYLNRNPLLSASNAIRSVARDGASARVFRTSPPEPWRIIRQKWRAADKGYKLVINDDGGWEFLPLDPNGKKGVVPTEYPVGYFTSATGITIYTGDAYPQKFHAQAFVGDVGGNLVHRKTVDSTRAVYSSERADHGVEFLSSSDNWFRPVNFVNAPDGSLYVLDMYRETVEHPHSIPAEIKKFLYLTSGRDRGRVYRLVSPDMKRRPVIRIGDLDDRQLVAQLDHDNGWNRQTAQRLIWERQDKKLAPLIEALLAPTSSPLGRMHALCTLDAVDELDDVHLMKGLSDSHPRVRAHAVRLAESRLDESNTILAAVFKLADDPNEHVRLQLAFSLGETGNAQAVQALARLARQSPLTAEIATAVLSSSASRMALLVQELVSDSSAPREISSLVSRLVSMIGSSDSSDEKIALLRTIISPRVRRADQAALLSELAAGINRRGRSIARLIESDAVPDELRAEIESYFKAAAETANDSDQKLDQRIGAIRLLGYTSGAKSTELLQSFLTPQTPSDLQLAAVTALGQSDAGSISGKLLDAWDGFSPEVRRAVIDAMLSDPTRLTGLLQAIEEGTVKVRDIDRDKKTAILNHPKPDIRKRAASLLVADVNADRARVVDAYQDILKLSGDIDRGRAVFGKRCSICHKVGDTGHAVAPDLASVKNKSEADLLIAILDPNREAQPNFNVYTLTTDAGRVFSGIIVAENANNITLRKAEAKEDTIRRSDIDEMRASGVSLMPEGLEKDLSKQDLADVIRFVKAIGQSAKTGD